MMEDLARDVLVVSATQVGKTFALACWETGMAMRRPSPVHPWWWLAPTFNQTMQGFRLMHAFAVSAGILERATSTPFPVLRYINGSFVEFRSWEREQNLLGTTIAGAVIDEAGLLTPQAQSVISTRRSSTLGPLRYIGNPGTVAGPFRRLCALAGDPEWAGVISAHRWTWRDKLAALEEPHRSQYERFIEQERASLPEFEFRRLYEAEWTEDEAAVFRNVQECCDGQPPLDPFARPASDGFDRVIGVDVGQQVDYLAAIGVRIAGPRVDFMDRFRGIGYPQAAQRIQAIQTQYGAPVVVEVNGPGIALVQEFDRLGVSYIPFTTTNQSKQEIVLNLSADIQHGRLKIADLPVLIDELSRFKYDRSPSGLYRYSAPAGEHDDTVMALALACWGKRNAVDMAAVGWM